MKLRLLVALLCMAGTALASEPQATPAPRPRLTETLRRRAMAITPATGEFEPKGAPSAAEEPGIPYPVIGAGHGMVGRMNGPSPLSRPFGLREGGYLVRDKGKTFTTELALQYDAPNAGWDLFRLSW